MDLFVIDDSVQKKPSREGMGRLVAVGGLHIPSANIKWLERALGAHCDAVGLPPDEEFKWSPDRGTWMRELEGDDRATFFQRILSLAQQARATGCVVIEDSTKQPAVSSSESAEDDVVKLFLERAHAHIPAQTEAIVLADHPSGGRKKEAQFLGDCIRTLREGTAFVIPERIALVLTGHSISVRLLQLADVVVGCSLAYAGGESDYAPPLFLSHVKPILRSDGGRIGGVGLKLHPDFSYANLYYWLLGDTHLGAMGGGAPLPIRGRPYFDSAGEPK